jgi:hypothetical protein
MVDTIAEHNRLVLVVIAADCSSWGAMLGFGIPFARLYENAKLGEIETMTFGKAVRVQMMVAGLGMALFCVGATKAQEIVNTSFDDGPNVAALAQPAAPAANAVTVTANQPVTANTQLPAAAEPVSETESSDKMLWIGVCLVWLGAIGMYFSGPAKRLAREMRAVRESYKLEDAA